MARRKQSPKGLEASIKGPRGVTMPRCQARSRRSKQQCRKPARKGHEVCGTHGAGYEKRVREGKRESPATAPMKHGGHAQEETRALAARLDPVFGARVQHYLDDPAKLRDLNALLAYCWATLEKVAQSDPQVMIGKDGEEPPAIVATLQMLGATLERAARIEFKILQSSQPTLTVGQSKRLVQAMVELLHEFVAPDECAAAVERLEQHATVIMGGADDPTLAPEAGKPE